MKAYRGIEGSCVQVVQEYANEAEVVRFYVDPDMRGKGVGHRLMRQTCADADREGVVLYLEPVPFGAYDPETEEFHPPTLTYKQLCAFYREFGFRFMPRSELMKRIPRKEK
jgi:GNAT superfamily N-acetyltransferase